MLKTIYFDLFYPHYQQPIISIIYFLKILKEKEVLYTLFITFGTLGWGTR